MMTIGSATTRRGTAEVAIANKKYRTGDGCLESKELSVMVTAIEAAVKKRKSRREEKM